MKIRLVGDKFDADGLTDIEKVIFDFCNFANALKRQNVTKYNVKYSVKYATLPPFSQHGIYGEFMAPFLL
jgi:hypothetical protein